jgi:prevent-host-death family protein
MVEAAMAWQIQEAKAKFSELVQKAIDEGPQTVSRRGKDVAVVLSAEEYRRLRKGQIDFKEFLTLLPLDGLDLERSKDLPRDVDL